MTISTIISYPNDLGCARIQGTMVADGNKRNSNNNRSQHNNIDTKLAPSTTSSTTGRGAKQILSESRCEKYSLLQNSPKRPKNCANTTAAQEEKNINLRKELVEQLRVRVERAQAEGRVPPTVPAATFAAALEKTMFKNALNLEQHVDLSTLDARLSHLCSTLLLRSRGGSSTKAITGTNTTTRNANKKEEEDGSVQSSMSSKPELEDSPLKLYLGQERWDCIQDLMKQVQVLRFSWTGCCGCGGGTPDATLKNTLSSSSPSSSKPSLRGEMPDPVKQFFFGTRLFRLGRFLSLSALSSLSSIGAVQCYSLDAWDELIEEAENNLFRYVEWTKLNQVCTR